MSVESKDGKQRVQHCSQSLLLPPMAHLGGDQQVVRALLGQQLLMCPLFHHHSSLEDQDAVCGLDRGQTVGHNDTRPAPPGLVQRVLHYLERSKEKI